MEEDTKTEQFQDLDEVQLQTISGGSGMGQLQPDTREYMSRGHQEYAKVLLKAAQMARDLNRNDSAQQFKNLADAHIQKAMAAEQFLPSGDPSESQTTQPSTSDMSNKRIRRV